ncbi:hypothetical protein [Streptococcus halichoeri]|uniref:hypothetical protein n=1 Tax=Streptococcus halichoeri TaxID=254785 RepID=UPI0013589DB0|nr:hypothetical protein [Streptococcus halichoeri]
MAIWPTYLGNFKFSEIDRILKEKVDSISVPNHIKMRVVGCSALMLHLEAYDKVSENNLNSYRSELTKATKIDHGNLNDYGYHVGLCYINSELTQEERKQLVDISEVYTEKTSNMNLIFEMSMPHFAIFNNMIDYFVNIEMRGTNFETNKTIY